ncbi:MAG: biotin--[acetyl-CoA-carboxylase] ligase, partial [Gordonia sp. (in: high G+C Gram-positive bacteria)]|uniref:biotin--[acetyl-CoA-carboxylase] ligase n=1 Tax=Gordonia sp. (in: high G+C Gram-positive bacteria) TaxID=84139 RepID=UPI003BB78699
MDPVQLPDPGGLAGTRWTDVAVVAETGSTNADLVARAAAGEPVDGAVLIAGHQRTGRGRHARVWQTPAGQLAVSAAIAVSPQQTSAIGWLSLLTGLAVRSAVRELTGVGVDRKWPNDVIVPSGRPGAGRKLSGILCEFTPTVGGGGTAVIGTGLNVDLSEIRPPIETAWSLAELTGTPADPTAVAVAYLRALSDVLVSWPDDLA